MGILTIFKTLGVIVFLVGSYNLAMYYGTYMFFRKLNVFIKKDLSNDDVKYMSNEVNKRKLGRNSYNWDILAKSIKKVHQSDVDEDIKTKYYEICDEKGILVKKVIEEYQGV